MGGPSPTTPSALFQHPTSVILYGNPAALVDWVALAFASTAHGGYHWTDVRGRGQVPDPLGPVARGAIAEERLRVRDPGELAPDNVAANAAISSSIRDERPTDLRRLADFLRLPSASREFISQRPQGREPLVLVVSNARQLVPQFTRDTVRSILQAVVDSGFVVLASYPGIPGPNRFVFDNVWRLEGQDLSAWRSAQLEVEQADASAVLPKGSKTLLNDLTFVASLLARPLDESR